METCGDLDSKYRNNQKLKYLVDNYGLDGIFELVKTIPFEKLKQPEGWYKKA